MEHTEPAVGRDHFTVKDYWNFDMANARAQIQALTWFRENGQTYPGRDEASTMLQWNAILDRMIAGFQAYLDRDEEISPRPGTSWSHVEEAEAQAAHHDRCMVRFHEGMLLYVRWYPMLWD
jgi:hypothetical protein